MRENTDQNNSEIGANLQSKSMDWFLYDNGLRHERVKSQPHKMIKHTQTIRRQTQTNCLSVFDHFVELTLKGLISAFVKNEYVLLLSCLISEIWNPQVYSEPC